MLALFRLNPCPLRCLQIDVPADTIPKTFTVGSQASAIAFAYAGPLIVEGVDQHGKI